MTLLVFSDSHGCTEDMILTVMRTHPDALLHLGDLWRDAQELAYAFPELPLFRVAGNCDPPGEELPTEECVTFEGVTFLLTHGHRYGVKRGYDTALTHAEARHADVLLFGHTHVPLCECRRDIRIFNPGSVRYTRTYGRIEAETGTVRCELQSFD